LLFEPLFDLFPSSLRATLLVSLLFEHLFDLVTLFSLCQGLSARKRYLLEQMQIVYGQEEAELIDALKRVRVAFGGAIPLQV